MIPRLYVDADLATGLRLPLDERAAHYLRNVLRRDDACAAGAGGVWRR